MPPEPELAALVARCYRTGVATAREGGGELEQVARGSNGIVFRARSASLVLAAKVSQVDERGRAAREHAALTALSEAGLVLAPAAYGVGRSDGLDILFSGWCDGEPLEDAPPGESPVWRDVVDAWVIRLRQARAAPTPRLAGVASAVRESLEQRLNACEERAAGALGL